MRLGLRVRGAIAFALLAFLVSVALATLTYQIARTYLLDQRQDLVVRQAGLNARAVNALLGTPDADLSAVLASLPSTSGSHGVARVGTEWFSGSLPADGQGIPEDVVAETDNGRAAFKRVNINGTPTMVVGVPLTRSSISYFEVAPLGELQRTLSVLAWSLTAAAACTVVLGAALGLYASRRVLRPLREFSYAAEKVGSGRLDTRLPRRGRSRSGRVRRRFQRHGRSARTADRARRAFRVRRESRVPKPAHGAECRSRCP